MEYVWDLNKDNIFPWQNRTTRSIRGGLVQFFPAHISAKFGYFHFFFLNSLYHLYENVLK